MIEEMQTFASGPGFWVAWGVGAVTLAAAAAWFGRRR